MTELSSALKERGYRLTLQREIILDAVESIHGHISVDDIFRLVHPRFPQVNVSTIYRTMELLEEAGLVGHTHFHDGGTRWHHGDEAPHQHLVCRLCGAEQELDLNLTAPLARDIRERYGFEPELTHFAIIGVCRACQSRENTAKAV